MSADSTRPGRSSVAETRAVETSAGEAPTDYDPAGGGRRWSTRLFRSELWLIFGRRRNWVGLAVLCSLPIVINIATKVSAPTGGGPDLFLHNTGHRPFPALSSPRPQPPPFPPR